MENSKEEFEQLPSFLEKMKAKEDSFKVPENYFQEMPAQIWTRLQQDKLREKSTPKSWLTSLSSLLQGLFTPQMGLAFSGLVILIIGGVFSLQPVDNQFSGQKSKELIFEQLQLYIFENIDEFEPEWLVEVELEHTSNLEEGAIDEYLENNLDDIEIEEFEEWF